ncbi:telomere-associated protein RIF1 [Eurosta solidaginis]|uniref:telomere-associated protein RIF1 n=1 Tax=Eurosta solidaginis TaxID=178769 RepID=UPI003530FD99
MDSSLGRGFYEVYCSSKEIVNSKQRHLLCNMLDLLSNTTKSTPPVLITKIITPADLFKFWLEDILPIVFDKDTTIQGSAVSALEQGLLILDIGNVCSYTNWVNVKNVIVKEYASRLHELREVRSQYWHRIWCILIRILDREILKSASTINLFLSIVELGFRSPDNSVRAEAFTCWHLLIKVFATHSQLSSPKRLKLVCIPLKSSQSKTPYVAAVKLRIWWYLITCLGEQLEENFENVIEPFLIFCFGSDMKNTTGISHQYLSMREPSLTCLAAIMSTERDELLQRLFREYELETCPRLPIITSKVTQKYWKSILYAVLEATSLIIENDKQSDLEQRLLSIIIKSSTTLIVNYDMSSLFEYFFTGLMQFTCKSSRPISLVTNAIATKGLSYSRSISDFNNYVKTLQCLIKLLTLARDCVDPSKIHQCIAQVSSLDAFISKQLGWRAVTVISEYLFKMSNDEGFEYFEVKLLLWLHISSEIVNNIRNNTFGHSVEEFTDVLISWSLWPMRMLMDFTGRRINTIFDDHFYFVWHNLLQLTENTSRRSQHISDVGEVLSLISKSAYESGILVHLLNVYVDEVIKHDSSTFSKHYEQVLSVLCEVIQKNVSEKEKEKLLTILRCILFNLKTPVYNTLLEPIKTTIKHAIKSTSKGAIETKFFDEWKDSVINIIRSSAAKNTVSQLTDLFKDDIYVIIPSVWSLKPEKLTDRQKERFAEKTSIPALYNDMSQSQDTLIKPWTPKKIVIAKEDKNEIIIESSNAQQTEFNADIAGNFLVSPTPAMPIASTHNNKAVNLSAPVCTNQENVQDLPNSTTDKLICRDITERNQTVKKLEIDGKKSKQIQHTTQESLINSKTVHVLSRESLQGSLKYPSDDLMKDQPNEVRHDIYCIESKAIEMPNSSSGVETIKEMSPKKVSGRNSLLLSPPDRKLTNNNSSPKLRPKPPSHLTGRGAQLINMIRNKKIEPTLPHTPMPRLFVSRNDSMDRSGLDMDLVGMDNASTPLHSKDILTFSKRLPSPSASPSTSILKRNLRRDSLEDIALDSPACKKKRVSFHDPPVSVTKEYIKHNDENKTKPKRCLIMDKVQTSAEKTPDNKYALKRRSKLDSIIEIEKFSSQNSTKAPDQDTNSNVHLDVLDDDNADCLDCVNEVNRITEKNVAAEAFVDNYTQTEGENNTPLKSSENVFQTEIQKYSLEQLFEKYLEFGKDSKIKCYNTMAKLISNGMSGDCKVKENVLEALSENHSKDFLDHAIRENLASVVCDRLNLPSVIEYVCEKSKINTACRANLFLQMPDVMKYCKQDGERLRLLHTLLNNTSFKDNDILDLVNTLMRSRSMDKTSSATVSEAAIDSSSNL